MSCHNSYSILFWKFSTVIQGKKKKKKEEREKEGVYIYCKGRNKMVSLVSVFSSISAMIISRLCIKLFICLSTMSNVFLAFYVIFGHFFHSLKLIFLSHSSVVSEF